MKIASISEDLWKLRSETLIQSLISLIRKFLKKWQTLVLHFLDTFFEFPWTISLDFYEFPSTEHSNLYLATHHRLNFGKLVSNFLLISISLKFWFRRLLSIRLNNKHRQTIRWNEHSVWWTFYWIVAIHWIVFTINRSLNRRFARFHCQHMLTRLCSLINLAFY